MYCMYVYMYVYVYVCIYVYACIYLPVYETLSHLRSNAQAVLHNRYTTTSCGTSVMQHTLWLTKMFIRFELEFTISRNRTSEQQLWNVIIIAVIVFWIYNVFLDFNIVFCVNEIMLVQNSFPSKPNGYLLIVCNAEFGLPQADKVALHPAPYLSALLGHIQIEPTC